MGTILVYTVVKAARLQQINKAFLCSSGIAESVYYELKEALSAQAKHRYGFPS